MNTIASADLIGLTADIVAAYVQNNSVPAAALPDLIATGAGSKVDSWVGTGPNGRYEVATAIDAQTLEAHSRQSGCSRQELIARITTDLPDAINQMTQTATCQQITERMPRTG